MLNYPDNLSNEIGAYRLNENGLSGYYPISVGNFWHSGIHLPISSDTPVKPLVSGQVIAYRIGKIYQTIDLPKKLTKEKLEEKYYKHKFFYNEKDEIFQLNEKIPTSETKINLASNFILLKHHIQDNDGKNSLIFYTLYTNIASTSEKQAYQKNFITDGKIHILTNEDTFCCSLIGPAGYDRDEKYIEISCFMEKSLFDNKFKLNKPIFLSAENYKDFFIREPLNCEKKQIYFTNRSRYIVKETITSGNQIAKKIQIKSIAAYLPPKVKLTKGKIKDKTNINYIILNETEVKKNNTSKYNLINTSLDSFFSTCKSGKEYTVTNILESGQTQILIDCSSCEPVWIVDNNDFTSETDKESIYTKNSYVDYYEECPLLYSFNKKEISTIEEIRGLTSNTCFDKNKKEYCEIDGLPDIYVEKQAFEKKCYENAFKWEAFFDNQEEFEDDIFCDKLSILKEIDKSNILKEIFGTNRMISDDEMKMLFGPNEHSLEMKEVVKKLRKIECKHPLEFDKTKFENIADEYKNRKEWTMGTISENAANALKAQTKIRDIWTDGLCNVFKNNNFFFVHPVYFLNHLDKAGVLEFNPYKGEKLKKVTNTEYSTWLNYDGTDYDLTKEIESNPGFAPYDPVLYSEYGINGYACINTLFMEKMDYKQNGKEKKYSHEGIDFAGKRVVSTDKEKTHRTPIHSFINGTVVKTGDHKTLNFGKHLIISDGNNRLFLLGHLYDYADEIKVGSRIFPGDTVAYVGNTGNCAGLSEEEKKDGRGTHLHLTIFMFEDDFPNKVVKYEKKIIQDKVWDKIGTYIEKNNPSYSCYSNKSKKYKVVNPFDYSKERIYKG